MLVMQNPIHTKKTVSVVIATFNGAKYIDQQIQSVINQAFKPIEIIVCDDGSIDNTIDIVLETRRRLNNEIDIKIFKNKKRLGFRDNFLHASARARGDFIAFCDQDDIWEPSKLGRCARYFDDVNVSLIVHAAYLIDKNSEKIGLFRQGIHSTCVRPPLSYDPWLTFFGFSMVFRRELLSLFDMNHRFIDFIAPSEKIAHDRWVLFLAQMVGSTVELEDYLVGYRQHESNTFGDGRKRRKRRDIKTESQDYILATQQMIDIVNHISPKANSIFPLFDRKNCTDFLNRALYQLMCRDRVYNASTKREAFFHIWRCYASRGYRAAHNNRTRWRSILKDLKVSCSEI